MPGTDGGSPLSPGTLMRRIGSSNEPSMEAGKMEPDPFLCNPSVWASTASFKLVKVLNKYSFVESMGDDIFAAAWRRVASDGEIAKALDDEVVVAMAFRAFDRNKPVTFHVEDNVFWPTGEQLSQKAMVAMVNRPYLVCFMGKHDFRQLLVELSDHSLKKMLDDLVKKVVIVRCGVILNVPANKTALNSQVVKSKNKFLKGAN